MRNSKLHLSQRDLSDMPAHNLIVLPMNMMIGERHFGVTEWLFENYYIEPIIIPFNLEYHGLALFTDRCPVLINTPGTGVSVKCQLAVMPLGSMTARNYIMSYVGGKNWCREGIIYSEPLTRIYTHNCPEVGDVDIPILVGHKKPLDWAEEQVSPSGFRTTARLNGEGFYHVDL